METRINGGAHRRTVDYVATVTKCDICGLNRFGWVGGGILDDVAEADGLNWIGRIRWAGNPVRAGSCCTPLRLL